MPHSRPVARALAAPVALLGALAVASPAGAQAPGSLALGAPNPELRVDAIVGDGRRTVQGGAGVLWPVGRAVRAGIVAGVGVADGDAVPEGPDVAWRGEVVAHFVVRTSAAGRPRLYVGAGAGALVVGSGRGRGDGRGVAHVLLGVEGARPGWAHAVELGLGGGVRLGVALRRAR